MGRRVITREQFHAELKAQGVKTHADLAFVCPMCKTVQSGRDLIRAGAGKDWEEVEKYVGFSCVGRWTSAGMHRKGTPPGKGCNWTLGGLLQLHELEVVTDDEKRHPRFEPATPEVAKAHLQRMEVSHG